MRGTSVCKWVTFWGLAGLGVFCVTFILLNQWDGNLLKHRILSILDPGGSEKNTDDIEDVDTLNEIQQIIEMQREMIRDDMIGYEYPNGKYNLSATKLEDLMIEENGRPIRSIIVSTWRSGSTFLGAILNAHPGDFYFFEPLIDLKFQIRGPPLAAKALQRVKGLLNCQYTDEYIETAKIYPRSFNQSTNLWKQCRTHKNICYNDRFLTAMCKLFPFQSMKLVRVRLHVAKELLSDEELVKYSDITLNKKAQTIADLCYVQESVSPGSDVGGVYSTNTCYRCADFHMNRLALRIVLLVRDPRGTLQSRKHHSWCPRMGGDCTDPASLCADLVSDHTIAMELLQKYPTTFRVMRYEDLAVDPYKQVEELYRFYERYFHPNVKKFLDTHTRVDFFEVDSLSRNSKETPFHWRTNMEFEEVEEIQRACSSAMELWGYLPAMNATHLKEFNPVTDYVLR